MSQLRMILVCHRRGDVAVSAAAMSQLRVILVRQRRQYRHTFAWMWSVSAAVMSQLDVILVRHRCSDAAASRDSGLLVPR